MDRVELNVREKRCNAFWMPRRDPHRKIALKQPPDDAPAEKASPAEDGHLPSRHCSVPRDAAPKFRLWTPPLLVLPTLTDLITERSSASGITPAHQILLDHRSDFICKTISTPSPHRTCARENQERVRGPG